jgi:FAD/FMN-containing dehydrogenase
VEYRRGDKIDFPVPAIPLPGTTKSTAGYPLHPGMDWIDLLCGSEGTLGVVLQAEVTLLPVPADLFSAVVFFPSDDDALDAVDAWRSIMGLRMLEYADRNSLDLLRSRYPEIPPSAAAALLIESEGSIDVDEWDSRLNAAHALSDDSWLAVTARDRERFREFRHALPELVNATVIQGGFQKAGTDYAVPVLRNREMLSYYRRRLEAMMPGQYLIFGHIGDAHVHVNMLPATKQQEEATSMLFEEFAMHAVELGGTVSAEHGLGKRKAHLLRLQYSPEHIDAMMDVKGLLDPQWLLGRGTLFPVPARFTDQHG